MISDTQIITRVFKFTHNNETIELSDPNANLPIESIKSMLANQYPQLLNASIIDKGIENKKLVYEFQTIAGTKG